MKTWRNEKLLVLNDESWAAVDLYYRAAQSNSFFSFLCSSEWAKKLRKNWIWRAMAHKRKQSAIWINLLIQWRKQWNKTNGKWMKFNLWLDWMALLVVLVSLPRLRQAAQQQSIQRIGCWLVGYGLFARQHKTTH